jgi:hypothetical protein
MRVPILLFSLFPYAFSAHSHAPNAKALNTRERIRINGKLDEPAWKSAEPIGDLTQVLPEEDETSSERTEVWILVDDSALYFGLICYDRAPSALCFQFRSSDSQTGLHLPLLIL